MSRVIRNKQQCCTLPVAGITGERFYLLEFRQGAYRLTKNDRFDDLVPQKDINLVFMGPEVSFVVSYKAECYLPGILSEWKNIASSQRYCILKIHTI